MYQRRVDRIFKGSQLIWRKLGIKIHDALLKSLLIILDHFYRNLILLIKIRMSNFILSFSMEYQRSFLWNNQVQIMQ